MTMSLAPIWLTIPVHEFSVHKLVERLLLEGISTCVHIWS